MAGGATSGTELTLEDTPTWIVAAVCSVIVIISIFFERLLHCFGKRLKRKNRNNMFEALEKMKEELMLLGFISLLLTVLQGSLQKICVKKSYMDNWLPCKSKKDLSSTAKLAIHDFVTGFPGSGRRLLAGGNNSTTLYCEKKGGSQLLSSEAIHELHIFIFALAATHVILSAIVVLLGLHKLLKFTWRPAQIKQWRRWENDIQQELATANGDANAPQFRQVKNLLFIQDRYKGFGKAGGLYGWLRSFFKQFYGSITREDYEAMRLGFINTHCPTNRKFNFYKYMLRVLEADFKKVVGISWYLWGFVMLFMLLNLHGWHVHFWIAWFLLLMLVVVGTKLNHVIMVLAHEVAEKHQVLEGDLLVTPSDELFWFRQPKIVLVMIHFILFQNAFEITYFFWVLTTFKSNSCLMGRSHFLILRLVVSVIIQFLCCYSTLPLYVIVSHMGSSFKREIFEENVQMGLIGWAKGAKQRQGKAIATRPAASPPNEGIIQMSEVPTATLISAGARSSAPPP